MTQRLLVTGTDTGVGKTFCACMLAAAARLAGLRVGVMKPVETGWPQGSQVRPDALELIEASETTLPIETICPYRFSEPLAPAIAARRAGVRIDTNLIEKQYETIAKTSDLVLLEGAGGLLVPLVERTTFADLATILDLSLVIVVGSRLGAINHALLTIESARRRGLDVLGYIMNHPQPLDVATLDSNLELIGELADAPCLGTVPHLPSVSGFYPKAPELARLARQCLDLRRFGIARREKTQVGGAGTGRTRSRRGRRPTGLAQ